jgi:hypothetical protein
MGYLIKSQRSSNSKRPQPKTLTKQVRAKQRRRVVENTLILSAVVLTALSAIGSIVLSSSTNNSLQRNHDQHRGYLQKTRRIQSNTILAQEIITMAWQNGTTQTVASISNNNNTLTGLKNTILPPDQSMSSCILIMDDNHW